MSLASGPSSLQCNKISSNDLVPQRGNFVEMIHTTWFEFGAVFGPTGSIAILYIVGANLLMTAEGRP